MQKAVPLEDLSIEIYVDDGKQEEMVELSTLPYVKGFTTNPSLLRKAGITDYQAYAHEVLAAIPDKAISFEVIADDMEEMERQARIVHAWGKNVFVKIPIMTTNGTSTAPLIQKLSAEGIALNVTLLFTLDQVREVAAVLHADTPAIVSVFAGRIADAGINPSEIMRESKQVLSQLPNAKLLWASSREIYNIYEAEACGSDIITVPYDLLKKTGDIGTDLHELSLRGVKAFVADTKAAGFSL